MCIANTFYFSHAGFADFFVDNLVKDAKFPISCDYTSSAPPPPMPTLPPDTAKVRGKVLGLDATETAEIALQGNTYSGGTFTAFNQVTSSSYESFPLFPDTYGITVGVYPINSSVPTRAINLPKAFTMQDKEVIFDIDLAKAVTLDNYTFSVKGLKNPSRVGKGVYANFLPMYKTLDASPNAPVTTTFSYAAFPKDTSAITYNTSVIATDGDCSHDIYQTFKTAMNKEVSVIPCPTLKYSNEPKPSLSWILEGTEKPEVTTLAFRQSMNNNAQIFSHIAGVIFLGDAPASNSYTLEDFSKLPGWKAEWSLKNEATNYDFIGEDRKVSGDDSSYRSVRQESTFTPVQ